MAIDTFFHGFRDSQFGTVMTATGTIPTGPSRVILINTAGGAVTATLPPASEMQWQDLVLRKIGGGTNAVTVSGATGLGAGTTAIGTMEDDGDWIWLRSNGMFWATMSQVVGD